MLRYFTAGESHGKYCSVILEGMPAGLKIDEEFINSFLERRQGGYGRGKRMQIEKDRAEVVSGIRWGETLGSPICISIRNKDWENWQETMSVSASSRQDGTEITRARPGHADISGVLKYGRKDVRDILERASARETAARVAAGAVAIRFLEEFGINIASYVDRVGSVTSRRDEYNVDEIKKFVKDSSVGALEKEKDRQMAAEIDRASSEGDTVGASFTVVAGGVPPGVGSHVQWDRKLDARLAMAIMSIQAVKGVEFGAGFDAAASLGSLLHDEIGYDKDLKRFTRTKNAAGGIEGGMSNGEPIVIRAAMKPISSLQRPLNTVDVITKHPVKAEIVRSDVCAVTAAGVVGEAVAAIEIASLLLEKTGGDSISEIKRNLDGYIKQIEEF